MIDTLAGSRVLVTGGAGFIGSTLVRRLLAVGADVTVLDNYFSGGVVNITEVADRATIIEGDVLDRDRLDEVFSIRSPEYVFHLVGDTFVPSAYHHPLRFLRINTEGTLAVLEAAREFGVRRMLYVSSTEVYGRTGSEPITESQALDPVNTYAVTKLAADRLCYTFHREHEIPVVIGRIFNSYGPRETQPYVVPEIIRQLAQGPVVRLGNIDAARDFTYVDDTADGLIALMTSIIPNGEAAHIGSGHLANLETIVDTCARLMGRDGYRIERDPLRERHVDIDAFHADASTLRTATGWAPRIGLEEGLRRTIDWFRANGSRWMWEDWCPDGIIRAPQPLRAVLDTGSPRSA
jgi:nucleoside-diphosphate-sugar epimerase